MRDAVFGFDGWQDLLSLGYLILFGVVVADRDPRDDTQAHRLSRTSADDLTVQPSGVASSGPTIRRRLGRR